VREKKELIPVKINWRLTPEPRRLALFQKKGRKKGERVQTFQGEKRGGGD